MKNNLRELILIFLNSNSNDLIEIDLKTSEIRYFKYTFYDKKYTNLSSKSIFVEWCDDDMIRLITPFFTISLQYSHSIKKMEKYILNKNTWKFSFSDFVVRSELLRFNLLDKLKIELILFLLKFNKKLKIELLDLLEERLI